MALTKIETVDELFESMESKLKGLFKYFGMTIEKMVVVEDVLGALQRDGYVELDFLGHGLIKPDIPSPDFNDFYLPSLSTTHNPRGYIDDATSDRLRRAMILEKLKADEE